MRFNHVTTTTSHHEDTKTRRKATNEKSAAFTPELIFARFTAFLAAAADPATSMLSAR
jgi:hypothetical protein